MLFSAPLSAKGKKDTDEKKTQNDEWILCITAFDYSMLFARRVAGDVITRELVNKLNSVSYRIRISPEYAYYENYAWQQAVSTAAKAIANKQNERAQQLFRGDPQWRYRRNLKKIDSDLVKLREELAAIEAEKPLINSEPAFGLSQSNINGTYPEPPKPGAERRFCQSQNSDGILFGHIREFHGRYYIQLRLFALYTNSFIYEDDIIFSLEDSGGAVEEVAARLTSALSGSKLAAVAITANPPESQILLNRNYAGRGTVPVRERPPGKITIAASAEGFSPETVETELAPGELVNVDITLNPQSYSEVHIDAPGNAGAHVYQGSLYVGDAPLTLRLPVGGLNYVTLENWNGETAKGVFTAPDMPDVSSILSFKMKKNPHSGEGRVNKARRQYYWAWGTTWITGIAAWITYGMYTGQADVAGQSTDPAFIKSTNRLASISIGALIAVGAAVVNEFVWMGRYIYIATEKVPPILKQEKKKKK
jgi:hypothetical protein